MGHHPNLIEKVEYARTATDFAAFIALKGWTKAGAARELGLSRNTVDKYLIEGAPAHIGLACAALAFGLPAWEQSPT